MPTRATLLPVVALVAVACGGSTGETKSDGNAPGGGNGGGGGAATATPGGGGGNGAGDGAIVVAADIVPTYEALEELGSWQFEATVIAASSGGDLTVTGTERRTPEFAVDARHTTLGETFAYIRIGDDIWYDVGTGEFTMTDASSTNLIRQYEPFHLAGLVANATASPNNDYELIGQEQVNGVATTHYGLTQAKRAQVTERLGLSPSDWLGDAWIATDGGYLVRLAWGPATTAVMAETGGIGFTYDVMDIGCTCPVEPPG